MVKKRSDLPKEPSASESEDFSVTDTSSEESTGSDVPSDASDLELCFTGYNVCRDDFHCIQNFLSITFGRGLQSMRGGDVGMVDVSGLTRTLVDVLGEYVGTTAKSEESEGPLAYVGLLPLTVPVELFYGTNDPEKLSMDEMKAIVHTFRGLLMETARKSRADKKVVQKAEAALMTSPDQTAVIFHERYMNLPVEVGAPLYRQLLDDLPAAQEETKAFAPTTLLLIVPIFRELASQIDTEGPSKRRKKQRNVQVNTSEPAEALSEFQYYYAEDELLEHMNLAHWDFKVKTPHETSDSRRAFGDRGVDPARRVFILSMDEFRTFEEQCQALL